MKLVLIPLADSGRIPFSAGLPDLIFFISPPRAVFVTGLSHYQQGVEDRIRRSQTPSVHITGMFKDIAPVLRRSVDLGQHLEHVSIMLGQDCWESQLHKHVSDLFSSVHASVLTARRLRVLRQARTNNPPIAQAMYSWFIVGNITIYHSQHTRRRCRQTAEGWRQGMPESWALRKITGHANDNEGD